MKFLVQDINELDSDNEYIKNLKKELKLYFVSWNDTKITVRRYFKNPLYYIMLICNRCILLRTTTAFNIKILENSKPKQFNGYLEQEQYHDLIDIFNKYGIYIIVDDNRLVIHSKYGIVIDKHIDNSYTITERDFTDEPDERY